MLVHEQGAVPGMSRDSNECPGKYYKSSRYGINHVGRFGGSSKAHSRDGAVIIPAKMMRYIVRRNNSAALPRFSSIVNGHFYALDTYFDHYQRNARGYITGLITRWGVPVPFQPRWFLGCFNTSLTIDGGHMYR